MRASTIVMIGFAVVFGLLAVFIAQVWLNNQANMQAKNYEANKKPQSTRTIVVAKEPLRFGTELAATMLQEVPWPADSLPSGAFTAIKDILSGGRRVVLSAIEANEPVLALKITGAGQRATLSAGALARWAPNSMHMTRAQCSSDQVATFSRPSDKSSGPKDSRP